MKTTLRALALGVFVSVVVFTAMVSFDAAKDSEPTSTPAPLAVAIGRAAPVATPVAIAKDPVEAQLNGFDLTLDGGLRVSAGFPSPSKGGAQ